MADLATVLKGLRFAHPVLPGPGPHVAGGAEAEAAVAGGAAAVVLQTVTMQPGDRANPARCAYGKDGAFHREPCTAVPFEAWLGSEFPRALQAARVAGVPCIPAIGYEPDEVRAMGARLAAAGADALLLDTAHTMRERILPAVRGLKATVPGLPVIVRLAPHHGDDLPELAALLEPHADGFCLIGSFGPGLLLDVEKPGAAIAAPMGYGFTAGAPIRPIAQRFVFDVARRVSKPVIAAGGAMSGRDVAEYLMLGASAVMVATGATLRGPSIYGRMAQELDGWLTTRGYGHVGEVKRAYIRKYGHGQRVVVEKEESPQLLADRCIRCTFCEAVCFYDAIKAPPRTLPTIAHGPCFECGLCVSACPTDALLFRPRDQVTLLQASNGAAPESEG
jgi:dihydroorotate dehydrogenase (NAD+) catalytic subunit